jgi:hypothetical protein
VTAFVFRCHPVTNVVAGPTVWPVEATAEVLSWYRDFLPAQHDDLYGFFATMTIPPGDPFPAELHLQKACGVVWCYTGDPADADAAFAPVRRMAPQWEGIGSVPYPALQSAFDALYPKGLQWYWRGDFVRTVPDEAVASTHGSPRSCRRCTRPCTSTRSTARCSASGLRTPRGATATSRGRK